MQLQKTNNYNRQRIGSLPVSLAENGPEVAKAAFVTSVVRETKWQMRSIKHKKPPSFIHKTASTRSGHALISGMLSQSVLACIALSLNQMAGGGVINIAATTGKLTAKSTGNLIGIFSV